MDAFQKTVLGVALIILIIMLIIIGMLITKARESTVYPPGALNCPDYWVESTNAAGDILCQADMSNRTNVGDLQLNSELDPKPDNATLNFSEDGWDVTGNGNLTYESSVDFPGYSITCKRRKWANTYGVQWDGISNYNGC